MVPCATTLTQSVVFQELICAKLGLDQLHQESRLNHTMHLNRYGDRPLRTLSTLVFRRDLLFHFTYSHQNTASPPVGCTSLAGVLAPNTLPRQAAQRRLLRSSARSASNLAYTYSCTAERIYKARPTRTQQLKKPLKRVEVEVPEEFLPKKKGLAAKILKDKEDERKKKKKSRRSRSSSASLKVSIAFAIVVSTSI
ncbi:unnamed protein product [Mortierella alpina]